MMTVVSSPSSSSKQRSAGSSDVAQQRKSPSPSRTSTSRGSPGSSDHAKVKPSKPQDRKFPSKATPLPEKRVARGSEMQRLKVQEDMMKTKAEKPQRTEHEISSQSNGRVKALEGEVDRAKDSERKMLESLMSQTKQLEEAKMELEEAKLEIRALRGTIRNLEKPSNSHHRGPNPRTHQSQDEEIARLRTELKLATEAEEKSKKAMDDLAEALKEVASESNRAKERLAAANTEHLSARAEADHTMSMLKTADERLQVAIDEIRRLKAEAEESAAAWRAKEAGFIECMKGFEEEMAGVREENRALLDTQRGARDEISKLRDIMKQAVNEATVVKEALEITRAENSQLKDTLSEKEMALRETRQELESLKVSEAAALGSVEELKSLLAATSGVDLPPAARKPVVSFENVGGGSHESMNGSLSFRAPPPPPMAAVSDAPAKGKHRKFASLSAVWVRRVPSSRMDDGHDAMSTNSYDFDHLDMSLGDETVQSAWGTQKKKKPMYKKFGDMFRRSFHNK